MELYKGLKVVNRIAYDDIMDIQELYINRKLGHLKMLGSGVSGEVYKYDSIVYNDKSYAIKLINDNQSNDGYILHMLQGLSCIPIVYAYISKKLVVMEYIDGVTARDYLMKDMQVPVIQDSFYDDLMSTIYQIRDVGFIPYDLNLGNVMVNNEGLPMIVDVGAFDKIRDDSLDYQISQKIEGYREDYKYFQKGIDSIILGDVI